jgi:hypothetical protein
MPFDVERGRLSDCPSGCTIPQYEPCNPDLGLSQAAVAGLAIALLSGVAERHLAVGRTGKISIGVSPRTAEFLRLAACAEVPISNDALMGREIAKTISILAHLLCDQE